MKKHLLIMAIGALLCIPRLGAAEKKPIITILSNDEVTQLRKAISNYKQNKSREEAERVINWYREAYPGDKFVTSKMNEKARFDNPNLGQSSMQAPTVQPSIQQSQVQQSQVQPAEEHTCCICMENEGAPIPCENKHNVVICKKCLETIKSSTNLCPICRKPLIEMDPQSKVINALRQCQQILQQTLLQIQQLQQLPSIDLNGPIKQQQELMRKREVVQKGIRRQQMYQNIQREQLQKQLQKEEGKPMAPQQQKILKNEQEETQQRLDQLQLQLQNQAENPQPNKSDYHLDQQSLNVLQSWEKELSQLQEDTVKDLELIHNQLLKLEPQQEQKTSAQYVGNR